MIKDRKTYKLQSTPGSWSGRRGFDIILNMRSFICFGGLIVFSEARCEESPLVRVHPEPEKPYMVVTANKDSLSKGDKVRITVFIVNPTKEDAKIRCSDLFADDGSPMDGIVRYQFRKKGVAEAYAVPRGSSSSYAKIGNRPYDVIQANSLISDSFEWVCDQAKEGEYTFGFTFHASPFEGEATIKLQLNKPTISKDD